MNFQLYFKDAENIVLVGSGMYPYSLIDMYKRFPEKKYHGIEISSSFNKLANKILDKTPAKNKLNLITADAFKYDYSQFSEDDMIFISCDVDTAKAINQITKTSEARFWICAPYEKVWMFNLLSK